MTTVMIPPVLQPRAGGQLSSDDWRATLGQPDDERSWLALDFLGFGLSDEPRDASYSISDQADIVGQLLAREQRPVVQGAHDMGLRSPPSCSDAISSGR